MTNEWPRRQNERPPAAPPPHGFRLARDRVVGEHAERLGMHGRALPFGVAYLDRALGGIVPNDLVLLGAKTGIGKTALVTIIALHNCRQGRRVHYFALEAEEREIERRMKFQILTELYYRMRVGPRPEIRYLDWYMGRLDDVLGSYEELADRELAPALGGLHTYYRGQSFSADDFCTTLDRIKDETDLVILDHLHYLDSDDENENRGYRNMVKKIRDSALLAGKPVVVVAHVRKGDRRYEPLIPTIEDFHGSSDIPKIATKAIMLAAAYDQTKPEPYLWPTYAQVAKCRLDSTVTRYAALLAFNARANTYVDSFVLGKLIDGGRTFEEIKRDEWPAWARGAR